VTAGRWGRGALAALGVAVPLLPLLGLLAGVLDPPPTPFGDAPPGSLGARLLALPGDLAASGALGLLGRTLALAAVVAAAALPLGTWLGWVEQRARYPGARALAVLGLLPLAIPSYVLAATLRSALGPGGAVGGALGLTRFTGFGPAALALTLVTTPYVQLLVSAALARVPAEEEEAARVLGAGSWGAFRAAVLPRLRPTLALGGLLAALYAVADFGAVAMLDCPVLTWRLYQAVNLMRLDEAVLLGLATLAAALPLLAAAGALRGRLGARARAGVANPRPVRRRPLRPAVLAATYALHAGVVGLGVALPALTLGGWVAGGLARGDDFAPIGGPIRDTFLAALAGAAVTVLAAAGPAWVAGRAGPRLARWIERAVYLTSALPGVLLAFGLLLLALAASRWTDASRELYAALTGSGVLLVLGYAARFLSQAFAGLEAAVLGLDRRQEESARVLGAGPWRRLRRVTLPQLAPGSAAAALLCFLAIVKELPVTLLLGNAMGLRTLSFRAWDRYREAFLPDAGLAGLLLVGLGLVAVAFSLRWRRHV